MSAVFLFSECLSCLITYDPADDCPECGSSQWTTAHYERKEP